MGYSLIGEYGEFFYGSNEGTGMYPLVIKHGKWRFLWKTYQNWGLFSIATFDDWTWNMYGIYPVNGGFTVFWER